MSLFELLTTLGVFCLLAISWQDIASRKVSQKFVFLSVGIGFYIFFQSQAFINLTAFILVLIAGIFLSGINVVGGADSKILAILMLVIHQEYWLLYGVSVFISVLITLMFWLLGYLICTKERKCAYRERGIPLIPAISLPAPIFIFLSM